MFGWPVTLAAIGPPAIAIRIEEHDHDRAGERGLVLAEALPEELRALRSRDDGLADRRPAGVAAVGGT